MHDIEKLMAIEAIKQVKARYFRLMDQKKWDEVGDVFAPDVVCDFRGAMADPAEPAHTTATASDEAPLHGRDRVVHYMRTGLTGVRSVHHGHMAEITIETETTAHGIFAMFDRLRFTSGPVCALDGYGHYFETFRKIDGAWRIATLKLVRLQVVTVLA